MKYGIHTLDDFDVRGKTVLCRVDINQPVNRAAGTLNDTTRIEGCAPTVRELAERGARVVLLAHQGGDLEYKNYYTTLPHSRVLAELIGRPVAHVDDVCGPYARMRIAELRDGEVLLLDNVRFMGEELTLFETRLNLTPAQMAQTQVVSKLAPLADLFVCDAFAAAHRSQPTLCGFAHVLPSAMGRLFEREYTVISDVLAAPGRPCVFVIGGAKIQEAFDVMNTVLKNGSADKVITGGVAANLLLHVSGVHIGKASLDYIYKKNLDYLFDAGKAVLEKFGDKIVLPTDLACVQDGVRKDVPVGALADGEAYIDIGRQTADSYAAMLRAAKTVFINGPMGVFEEEASAYGTRTVWQAAADCTGMSVVGGGDSVTATKAFGLADKMGYLCTGGGALLCFLSGNPMPVIDALKQSAASA